MGEERMATSGQRILGQKFGIDLPADCTGQEAGRILTGLKAAEETRGREEGEKRFRRFQALGFAGVRVRHVKDSKTGVVVRQDSSRPWCVVIDWDSDEPMKPGKKSHHSISSTYLLEVISDEGAS